LRKIGLQVFKINPDGTTSEITSEGPVKDALKTDECYVLVIDDLRKVFLWKGLHSSVRSKFIGAKRSQEIRGQVGLNFAMIPLDEGDETDEFLKVIGGKTQTGIAKEIRSEPETASPAEPASIPKTKASNSAAGKTGGPKGGAAPATHPLREKPVFEPPKPAEGMNIAGSLKKGSANNGPVYTGTESLKGYPQRDVEINFDQIMQKLEEIKIPDGYERELIIIGNHAYAVVEKTQTFLGKKQVQKAIEEVGSIPEGVFFAEGYSPRVLSENGKVIAIEFLKNKGVPVQGGAPEYKDKRKILKDQIKTQLGGMKEG